MKFPWIFITSVATHFSCLEFLCIYDYIEVDLFMIPFSGGPKDGYSVGYYNVQLTKG